MVMDLPPYLPMNTEESKIRHLEAIQAVISRMANNSLAIKFLTGTITAAVIVNLSNIESSAPCWMLGAPSIIPSMVFCILDAIYLRQEQMFRKLYDAVRLGKVNDPFSMNFVKYGGKSPNLLKIIFSWSVIWFYLVNIVATLAVVGTRLW